MPKLLSIYKKKGGKRVTIYYELIRRVESGETFCIDFEKRTMKVGNQFLIKNGEFDESRKLTSVFDDSMELDDIIKRIEEEYRYYKFSLPSERNDNKKRKYFKALSINDLTDEQMIFAHNREVAQCRLEGFILCAILKGKFKWDEEKLGKWFYQSKNDPDLVILRKWIENN